MSDSATPSTTAERLVSIAFGGLILLLSLGACGWIAGWAVTWVRTPGGLPGDMAQVLLAASLAAAATGVGAWRLLLIGIPGPVLGLSLGRLVLALMALAAAIGAITA